MLAANISPARVIVMQKNLIITGIMLASLAYASNVEAGHRHRCKTCVPPPVVYAPAPCPTGCATIAVVSHSHYVASPSSYQPRYGHQSEGQIIQNADGTRSVISSRIVQREDGVMVRQTVRRTYRGRTPYTGL